MFSLMHRADGNPARPPGRALWEELPVVLQQQQPFWGSERGGPNSGPGFSIVFVEAVSVMRNRNQLRFPQVLSVGRNLLEPSVSWAWGRTEEWSSQRPANHSCLPPLLQLPLPNRHLCFYVLTADYGHHPIPREHQASFGGGGVQKIHSSLL